MKDDVPSRVRFGEFELELKSGELRSLGESAGEAILLREQVFQVLRLLVEREGKIVTREEIKSRLWPNDTVVDFDHSINAAIKALRRALGDSADDPRYIETLSRRGYRLMLAIEYLESAPRIALEKDREQREPSTVEMSENEARVQRQIKNYWWRAAVGAASALILVSAGYMFWRHFRAITPPKSERIMLAVLPFQNLTGDPEKEYLADGLTEEMISQLGRLNPEQLGVIARTSVMGYKHKDIRLDQIGRDLSVQYVLENSLRASGNRLRLSAQLIQIKDQTHLWSQDYDYPTKDVLNVEDDVAKAVAREIQLRLTSQQQAKLAQTHPVNPKSFDAYLQGNYFIQRDDELAARYFERATQLDPGFARAWTGLFRARIRLADKGSVPVEEGHRLTLEAVDRALSLDPNLAEAYAHMGEIRQTFDFDWTGGDALFQRAMALEPGNPALVLDAATSAARLGRLEEGLRLARRSVELDPLNANQRAVLGQLEYWMGALDEAVADLKRALELSPQNKSHIYLAEIYVIQGRSRDALAEIEQERTDIFRLQHYAIAYHALGRKKESDASLRELTTKYHTIAAFQIAQVYAFREQLDEAFEWLDRAYAQRDGGLEETKVNPLLKSLHNDPRYVVFLNKLHLPN